MVYFHVISLLNANVKPLSPTAITRKSAIGLFRLLPKLELFVRDPLQWMEATFWSRSLLKFAEKSRLKMLMTVAQRWKEVCAFLSYHNCTTIRITVLSNKKKCRDPDSPDRLVNFLDLFWVLQQLEYCKDIFRSSNLCFVTGKFPFARRREMCKNIEGPEFRAEPKDLLVFKTWLQERAIALEWPLSCSNTTE